MNALTATSGCVSSPSCRAKHLPWSLSRRHAAGFSLVEVLISIFVLALGLLGVAAVFPAVVRQQRTATDAVQGISIQRSVEQLLLSHEKLREDNARTDPTATQVIGKRRGWSTLAADTAFSPRGQWALANPLGGSVPSAPGIGIDLATGTMAVGQPGGPEGDDQSYVVIPVSDRLMPSPFAGTADPRFVWDFVARRVAGGGAPRGTGVDRTLRYNDDQIELAIFVRRIDVGIRTPVGRRLADVLTGRNGVTTEERRLPVTVDSNGLPRRDGRIVDGGGYSPILRMPFTRVALPVGETGYDPTQIVPAPTGALTAQVDNFNQIGQKFVDDVGVVHEVVEFVRDSSTNAVTALRIDPPLSADLLSGAAAPNGDASYLGMLFTPQVPASVSVMYVKR